VLVRQAMLAQGLAEEIPDRLLGSLRDYASQPGPTTSTVAELLGRPKEFSRYRVRPTGGIHRHRCTARGL
jgi:hypothetical protein